MRKRTKKDEPCSTHSDFRGANALKLKRRQHEMAKTSSIVKYRKSVKLVAKYRERRLKLKEIIRDPATSQEDRHAAQVKLGKIPRRALPVQLRNRCELTGRTRAVYRK